VTMGPTVRRRRLGFEWAAARSALHQLEEVAEQLAWPRRPSPASETGRRRPSPSIINAMLEMYGVDDPAQRQVLIDMAREGHARWWWSYATCCRPGSASSRAGGRGRGAPQLPGGSGGGAVADAGLCPRCTTGSSEPGHDEQIERLVDLRIKRQDVLERDLPLDVWLILESRDPPDHRRARRHARSARAADRGEQDAECDAPGAAV